MNKDKHTQLYNALWKSFILLVCVVRRGGRGRVHVYIGSERKSENTDVTKIMKIEESHTWIINKSIKRVWLVPRRTQRWYRSWFVSVPFDCILSLIFPTSPPSLCALILCYGPQQCCHNNKDEIKCWSSSGAMKTPCTRFVFHLSSGQKSPKQLGSTWPDINSSTCDVAPCFCPSVQSMSQSNRLQKLVMFPK